MTSIINLFKKTSTAQQNEPIWIEMDHMAAPSLSQEEKWAQMIAKIQEVFQSF